MTLPARRLATLVVVLAVAAAGCAADAAADRSGLQVVLFGDAVEVAGYERMVDAFAQTRPDLDVTLSPVATQDELMAKLTTAFAGGEPPDVFLLNFRKYGQFAAQDAIEPVQPHLDASEVLDEDDFAPVALDAFRFDGEELTCMPQNLSSLVVYYNADLFAAAGAEPPHEGWTWDDFLAAARAVTAADEGVYGLGTDPQIIRVAPFVWSNGGEVVDDPDDPTRLVLDEGPAREALDFFLDLSLVHGVVPPDAEEQSRDSETRFLDGHLGMFLGSRRSTPTLRTIEDFSWDVGPLPVAPGGEPASILHSDAYCMSADAGQHDDAWAFIEFAMGVEGQEVLAESGRTVPSRRDVARSDVFLEPEQPPASAQVFLDAEDGMRATPHTATWARVESEADDLLAEIYYGRVEREAGIRALVEQTAPLFRGPGAG